MSTETKRPEPDAAFNTLYDRVVVPVFFAKLASYGIQPQTREDAGHLLDIGHTLMQQDQLAKQAQADARGSFFAKAAGELRSLVSGQPAVAQAAADQWHKEAAAGLAQDPEVVAAAESMLIAAGMA